MFVHSCSLESPMQLLQNVYAARQRKPNQCSDFYFPVLLQVAAANCAPHSTPNSGCHSGCCKPQPACCLLPVSIHLSSVTLGGTEAACEYLSENVALVSATAAAATSATLPCPISRLGSWAISVIILSFQLVCKIPATLQCQLQLFSRALIKAWQFYSSSAQQLYSYCATGQLRLSHNLLTLYLIWICRSIDRSWHTEATARTLCLPIMRSYIFMHGTYSMQYAECRMKLNPAD